jgi:hypothetical protein
MNRIESNRVFGSLFGGRPIPTSVQQDTLVSGETMGPPTSRPLTYLVATWGGVTLTTLAVRAFKRRLSKAREDRISKQGGLLPVVSNVVEALEWRANYNSKDKIALESADGTSVFSWADYYEQAEMFARALAASSTEFKQWEQHGG